MSPPSDAAPSADGARRTQGSGILASWWTGWTAAVGMPGILLLKWLVNLTFAAAVVLPTALLLADQLGNSVVGDQAFEELGLDVALEFAVGAGPQLRVAALVSAPIALAYLLVNLYLTGGILHRLRVGRREPWAEFFASCNRNLWMLVRIGLLTLVLAAVVLGLPHWLLARLVEWLTEDAAGPQPLFYLTWLHWSLLLLLGSWLARVYDFARVAAFLEPQSKARATLLRAIGFTLHRGTKTLVLWLLLVLPPLLVTVLFATTPVAGGVGSMAAVWASLALGQALLALRILGSFAALGGQMQFMQGAHLPSGHS
jgi:hypothetical protein